MKTCAHFKKYLSECFHMKHLGPLKYSLCLELACGSSDLLMCPRKYVLDIFQECVMLGCKPNTFHME
uniref:Retrovirus-related Pol polyprotein from transposon TNT 1-94 n=1 Tax=Cajanus cajan TaxID=3821 RepID=A0A151UBY5_CAJCA|nr:hypothetical protein KK1_021051 [Cajanus cajan]